MEYLHRISVVFITDKSYLMQTWVAARSVSETKDLYTYLDIYIICDNLEKCDKDDLLSIINGISGVDIHFIDVDSSRYFGTNGFGDVLNSWTPAVLYKFLICDLVPKELERIIYLDGDMIIRKDLSSLFETELGDNYLGAVRDTFYDNVEHEKRMNLKGFYINTGCMLLNLTLLRNDNISQLLIDTKNQRPDLGLADQDTYNEVCRGRIKILPCKYNFYITSFLLNEDIEGFKKYTICPYDSRMEMIDDIAVIHMIHYRPWRLGIDINEFIKIENCDLGIDIRSKALTYILKLWIQYYRESPYYARWGWEKLSTNGKYPTLSANGLLSQEKHKFISFLITQECIDGVITVSYYYKGLRLITKRTNPTNSKMRLRLF